MNMVSNFRRLAHVSSTYARGFTRSRLGSHCTIHKAQRRYECKKCGRSFILRTYHQRDTLFESRLWYCKVCCSGLCTKLKLVGRYPFHFSVCAHVCQDFRQIFALDPDRALHLWRQRNEKLCSCNTCDRAFIWKNVLNRNLVFHNIEKSRDNALLFPYNNEIISGSYFSERHISYHSSSFKNDKLYFNCNKCVYQYTTKTNFEEEKNLNLPSIEDLHVSETSGNAFARRQSITEELAIDSNKKPYKCETCSFEFETKSDLYHHLQEHNKKEYMCKICGRCFNRKSYLKKHMLGHSGEKPNKCEICDTCFARKEYLKSHLKIHSGEKPHKCEMCGKCFAQKGNLNTHLDTHSGEKPYKCEICGECFGQKSYLNSHLVVHSGEKPYKCEICGECFGQKRYLNSHLLIHTAEKPHTCEICGKCFAQKGTLKNHLVTHSGEKPHKCGICGKGFGQKRLLDSHLIVHSGEKPHKCEICGKCFRRVGSLKRHLEIHSQ